VSFIETSTNEDSSLLNNFQVPDPRKNQLVKIDLTAKPKEGINKLWNENKVLNPQLNNENSNSGKNPPLDSVKGTTPCPLLKRRGWCVKGSRCNFEHPRDEEKHLVPCPFLQKRGYCLKGIRCDFSHSANFSHNILSSRPVNN
jgi:hypothetical protein